MRLKKLVQLFLASSLLLQTACGSGPKLRVYISDPEMGGMHYSQDKLFKSSGFVPFSDTDKFNCMSPNDFSSLLTYCRLDFKNSSVFSSGPQLTVYISDPHQNGMEFHNPITDESGFVAYSDTDKFACLTPEDTTTLLNYCRTKDDHSEKK